MGKLRKTVLAAVAALGMTAGAGTASAQAGIIAAIGELGIKLIESNIADKAAEGAQIAAILTALNDYSGQFDQYKEYFESEYMVKQTVRDSYYLRAIAEHYLHVEKVYETTCRTIASMADYGISDATWASMARTLRAVKQLNKEIDSVRRTILSDGNYSSFERISMLTETYNRVVAYDNTVTEEYSVLMKYGDLNPLTAVTTDAESAVEFLGL